MAKYRNKLPQLNGELFLTDGGLETTLIFHDGFDLPEFAAFDILKTEVGREALRKYFISYTEIAKKYQVGIILESPTWRASSDWAEKIGYSREALADMNRQSIEQLVQLRDEYEDANTKIVISGCVGPRGDGYNPEFMMTAKEAEEYHLPQIKTFSETEADLITAITMGYSEEAIGLTRAAQSLGMPVVISFIVETDGNLLSGETLQEVIEKTDAATNNAPAYYMINCAHPTHFEDKLKTDEVWLERIHGIRANASSMSHAELDEAEELDDGNPTEFGQQYQDLLALSSHINVLGGCCGTDHRHIEEVAKSTAPQLT
jgi:S-methylmethionine-dependent homocysteine/selenocysteine methylase